MPRGFLVVKLERADQPPEDLLREVTRRIFAGHDAGFAGAHLPPDDVPVDWDTATARMIDEMGVDRHTEEIQRAADQKEMSAEAFERLLAARGITEENRVDLNRESERIPRRLRRGASIGNVAVVSWNACALKDTFLRPGAAAKLPETRTGLSETGAVPPRWPSVC